MQTKFIDACFDYSEYKKTKTLYVKYKQLQAGDVSYMVDKKNVQQVKKLNFWKSSFGPLALKQLARGNWISLTEVNIDKSKEFVYAKCKQLSGIKAKNLQKLSLWGNNIQSDGFQALTKAKWKNITKLNLGENQIEDDGCVYLKKTGWKLTLAKLNNNGIGHLGAASLASCPWRDLDKLYLDNNQIGDIGCKWISQADWPKLNYISLYSNFFSKAGCRWLSKANWKELTFLNLEYNDVFWDGCRYLSFSIWLQIKSFDLNDASIGDQGWFYIVKANWKSLTQVHMRQNDVQNAKNLRQFRRKFFPKALSFYL